MAVVEPKTVVVLANQQLPVVTNGTHLNEPLPCFIGNVGRIDGIAYIQVVYNAVQARVKWRCGFCGARWFYNAL